MIECRNLCLSFGGRIILDQVSFDLAETGTYALMGSSGIGKSSLLKIMAGLLPPDSGRIIGLKSKRIGFVFQEDRLLPWYSAVKNVMLAMDHPSRERASSLLNAFEIEDIDALPAVLSGGMKRRVALARAAAFEPDVLLLDEPFSGIDGQLKTRIMPLIKQSASLIIFSTHDTDETREMDALNVLTITNGKMNKT